MAVAAGREAIVHGVTATLNRGGRKVYVTPRLLESGTDLGERQESVGPSGEQKPRVKGEKV